MRKIFFAKLNGRNEVPPVKTGAFGKIHLELTKKWNLKYKLDVNFLKNFTQAHLHLGSEKENGPVVAFLFKATEIDSKDGAISVSHGTVSGIITRKDLTGPLKGKSIRDLIRLINKGQIYTNVHTFQNQDGEIRGQVCRVYY